MLSATNAAFKSDDPYEILIQQMIRVESQPKTELETRRKNEERMGNVLKDFDSKLSALHTLAKSFTDTFSNPFEGRAVSNGSTDAFSISATDEAAFGTHSLTIERLASTDTRISKQMTSSSSDLVNFFSANGAQTFQISVASPTDADPDNRVAIDVTVNPSGTTDEGILKEVAIAINDAMAAAGLDNNIKSTEKASASVINETSTTARLSLRSGQTGFANRLQFTDSGDGLLALLELGANVVASGTGGGQVKDVGTSETDSALNSKFVLDGLTLYRSTNQVTNAVDGLTLTLKQVTTTSSDFSVEPDAEGIKSEVESFITSYNDVMSYIIGKTKVDPDAGTRGDFAGDSTVNGLRFGMRSDIALQVPGQPSDGPQFLSDLGITIKEDGTLSLDDSDKLLEFAQRDAGAVQSLFAGTDGIATRLQTRLDSFLGIDGIIKNRENISSDRVKRLDDQIERWDDRMSSREKQLRQQFARLQEAIALFQGQQASINSFFYGTY